MAYSLTSAANPKALLAEIVTFATAQGWTIAYDHANGSGSSQGGQIALSSGNCFIAIGEQGAATNPVPYVDTNFGSGNDGRLNMALATSLGGTVQYWGHPGSLVGSATDQDRCVINDVLGPMTEVHFFGDEDFIVCAIKCEAQRWTMFSFGNLNVLGMGADPCGFCLSNYHQFWNTDANFDGLNRNNVQLRQPNNFFPVATSLTDAATGCGLQMLIPAGLLDATFGFDATAHIVTKTLGQTKMLLPIMFADCRIEASIPGNSFNSYMLDHVVQERVQPTTGGMPLYSIPAFYYNNTLALHSFLGEFPDIRACRMTNVSPGDSVLYGSEEYLVFPWKRVGSIVDSLPSSGDFQPNSYDMAWAIKKVV